MLEVGNASSWDTLLELKDISSLIQKPMSFLSLVMFCSMNMLSPLTILYQYHLQNLLPLLHFLPHFLFLLPLLLSCQQRHLLLHLLINSSLLYHQLNFSLQLLILSCPHHQLSHFSNISSKAIHQYLQDYHCHQVSSTSIPQDSFTSPSQFLSKPWSCNSCTPFPLNHTLSYHKLSPSFHAFTYLSSHLEPTSYGEAVKDFNWCKAMNAILVALKLNQTWTLTHLTSGKEQLAANRFIKLNTNWMRASSGTKHVKLPWDTPNKKVQTIMKPFLQQ